MDEENIKNGLFSKSIQSAAATSDGIRICIMRKPDFSAAWDIWTPTLAPSLELLSKYNSGVIDWSGYVELFNEEVIKPYNKHIKLLVDMARDNKITLLCWEKTPEKCHRRLIVEEAYRIEPTLYTLIH